MIDETPTVFIIDDDPSARRGLSRLVRAYGMETMVYDSAQDFLSQPLYDGHGCILLDVDMPELSGLELQIELMKTNNTLPIIFISGQADVPDVASAMKKGAVDFLTKPVDREHLLKAITESLERNREKRKLVAIETALRKRLASLTPREYSVLEHVISGRLNKQIAYTLGITEDTVKVHRGRVMKKMGADSLADLVRLAENVGVKPAEVEGIKK